MRPPVVRPPHGSAKIPAVAVRGAAPGRIAASTRGGTPGEGVGEQRASFVGISGSPALKERDLNEMGYDLTSTTSRQAAGKRRRWTLGPQVSAALAMEKAELRNGGHQGWDWCRLWVGCVTRASNHGQLDTLSQARKETGCAADCTSPESWHCDLHWASVAAHWN